MSVRTFENQRWRHDDQRPVFRHTAVMGLVDGGPVLDIGCGDGLLLELLSGKNIACEGIDIAEEGVRKCLARGVSARVGDFADEPLPYADGQFAASVLMDVLEHVYAPERLLAEALRVAPVSIVSVPNFSSLPARVQTVLGRVPENNTPGKGHVYWFNREKLLWVVAASGGVVEAERFNTFWEAVPIISGVMRVLADRLPSLFALSFVIRVKRRS